MALSVFSIFKIGIGPSSSHTVGPMKAAYSFIQSLAAHPSGQPNQPLNEVTSIQVDLYGSLALTGKGHGTDKALVLGLMGETPEDIDPTTIHSKVNQVTQSHQLSLGHQKNIPFDINKNILFHRTENLPLHPNGMKFTAFKDTEILSSKVYYSVGGGFIVDESQDPKGNIIHTNKKLTYPFGSAEDLLKHGEKNHLKFSDIIFENEKSFFPESEIRRKLDLVWSVMQNCIKRGFQNEGSLPGALKVKRRAPELYRELTSRPELALKDPLTILDWVNLYALSVNEENASYGQVVTAPTNGAAGIIPAVLMYYDRFCPQKTEEGIHRFLLTAGGIGMLYKMNASISGAEVGCQGEIGVACSMAAAGLTEVLGGTNAQVENAAEIAMEHNLGLTCDPVGGLVQIPCIERNAMGAIKAINASRMALRGDGKHFISLDKVIETMMQTGADMSSKYKETSRGGLAVNFTEC